ncbi:MAG TPA: hypothetical protein VNE17_03550 [Nitrolancea sp.]|nr:hypothetical protein [Nitrolancea sp.]
MTTLILALETTTSSILASTAQMLEQENYRVACCYGSAGSHEQIQDDRPDVVLAAHWLETRDAGWRLIEELSWDPRTNAIPMVIVAERQTVEREGDLARELDCLVINEPIDLDLVLSWIRERCTTRASMVGALTGQLGGDLLLPGTNDRRAA